MIVHTLCNAFKWYTSVNGITHVSHVFSCYAQQPLGVHCKKCNVNLMSAQGVLAQSPEPEARDKVLDNNPD